MWLWCFSLFSKEVFEGAEGNLLRIFEKNRSLVHRIKELPLDEPRPNERLMSNKIFIHILPFQALLLVVVSIWFH